MTKIIQIEGMSCEHCAKRITNVLSSLEGVNDVEVNFEQKQAILDTQNISNDILKNKIEDIGFTVKDIKEK